MKLKLIKTKQAKAILWILFLIYLALLIKVILFKYPMSMIMSILQSSERTTLKDRILYSNYIPTKTIFYYLSGNQCMIVARDNILGNIIAFGPLGFLLPILFSRIKKLKSVISASFILSLTFELIQLLTGIGSFDVDDIILNVFGAICGYIVYKGFINLIFKRHNVDINS